MNRQKWIQFQFQFHKIHYTTTRMNTNIHGACRVTKPPFLTSCCSFFFFWLTLSFWCSFWLQLSIWILIFWFFVLLFKFRFHARQCKIKDAKWIHACMYICMYACMHVYMYVCMYACTHVSMYACMYACMHACVCGSAKSRTRNGYMGHAACSIRSHLLPSCPTTSPRVWQQVYSCQVVWGLV